MQTIAGPMAYRDGPIVLPDRVPAWPIRLDGLQSAIRTVVRSCGDVWIRQGLATGEREPRMLLRPR